MKKPKGSKASSLWAIQVKVSTFLFVLCVAVQMGKGAVASHLGQGAAGRKSIPEAELGLLSQ